MMSYDKSDIRFELRIFENLILVEKMKKIELFSLFLGTSKAEDYHINEWLLTSMIPLCSNFLG